jgi:raffinose/stachyose/melibiose transport system permease protein
MRLRRPSIKGPLGHVALLLLGVVALFPLFLVALNSVKSRDLVVQNPLSLPDGLHLENFKLAWNYGHFGRGFINSITLTTTTVVVVLICSSLAGYVLAGKKIKMASGIMGYFLVAMTVPIQLFLFPLYFAYAKLHLLGNVVAVGFIIAALNMPLSVLLMRTFFLKIPRELEEAARIDGASTYQLLRHVMLPIVRPGLITVGVITALLAWNEFLISSTFLQGESSYTATLGYLTMNGTFSVDQGVMMAGAMILILPILIAFIAVQKYFVDGFVSGAVKG